MTAETELQRRRNNGGDGITAARKRKAPGGEAARRRVRIRRGSRGNSVPAVVPFPRLFRSRSYSVPALTPSPPRFAVLSLRTVPVLRARAIRHPRSSRHVGEMLLHDAPFRSALLEHERHRPSDVVRFSTRRPARDVVW